jgi:hypothetical protein
VPVLYQFCTDGMCCCRLLNHRTWLRDGGRGVHVKQGRGDWVPVGGAWLVVSWSGSSCGNLLQQQSTWFVATFCLFSFHHEWLLCDASCFCCRG